MNLLNFIYRTFQTYTGNANNNIKLTKAQLLAMHRPPFISWFHPSGVDVDIFLYSHTVSIPTLKKAERKFMLDCIVKGEDIAFLWLAAKTSPPSGNTLVVNLSEYKLDPNTIGEVAYILRRYEGEIAIKLCKNSISIDHVKAINLLLKLDNVVSLDLSHNHLSDEGAIALSHFLGPHKSLTTLNIAHNHIGPQGIKAICKAVESIQDFTLNIAINKINANVQGINAIRLLLYRSKIASLNLMQTTDYALGSSICGNNLAMISQSFASNTTLSSLFLGCNDLRDRDAITLARALEFHPQLTTLHIENSYLGNDGAIAISKVLLHNSTLTKLNLHHNCIGPSGARPIGIALKSNTTLTQLNLRKNGIGSEGVNEIAKSLRINSTLTILDLADTDLGAQGVKMICNDVLRPNGNLTALNLADNFIGPKGAIDISRSLRSNTNLTWLNLDFIRIGDAGAKSIHDLLQTNQSLTYLDLKYNQFNEKSIRTISRSALSNTTLTSLNLSRNNFEDEKIHKEIEIHLVKNLAKNAKNKKNKKNKKF